MSLFEQYLEVVKNSIYNEKQLDDQNKLIIQLAASRGPRKDHHSDGVFHYFNRVQDGAIFGYDPVKFKRANFNKIKEMYIEEFDADDFWDEDENHGMPDGFVGWVWGKAEED